MPLNDLVAACGSVVPADARSVAELAAIGVIEPDEPILLSHRERVKKAYPAYFETYAQMDTLRACL